MRAFSYRLRWTAPACAAMWLATCGLPAQELIDAFAFGSRMLDCPTANDPSVNYTIVFHGSDLELEYDEARGWGYEALWPDPANRPHGDRGGYGIFGPFDDSPNNRNQFPDTCPEQLYDSFIGAKTFLQPCDEFVVGDPDAPCSEAIDPDGIIFRVDVPNGFYRFVAAVGSADNNHVSRILAEDGGSGPPIDISANSLVLVNNHNQAEYGAGNFARVGFDDKLPPSANGPRFTNIDEEGFPTACDPNSPVLEVTEGYIRIHQLQGNSNPGAAGNNDRNGGNMVILELWRFDAVPQVEPSVDCEPSECELRSSGGPSELLVIGPIDLFDPADGQDVSSNGNCNDADGMGNDFSNSDYLINADGSLGEHNLLVEEGDELEPDFLGLSRGAGVPFGANIDRNPDGADGILTVWRADTDPDGYVNYNDLDNVGDPVDDYIVYALSYLENTTGSCLDVILEVGSDDAVKVLLNGQLVHASAVCRGIPGYGGGDMLPVTLAPGINIVLIGVVERGGGTGVRLVVRDTAGRPLTDGSVLSSCGKPDAYPQYATITRSIQSEGEPGGTIEVTLSASNVNSMTTIVESFPQDLLLESDGGGMVQGNTITFTVTADGDTTYILKFPEGGECPFVTADIVGQVSFAAGCGVLSGDSTLSCTTPPCELDESIEAELIYAFHFGSRVLACPTHNDPGQDYIGVIQTDPLSLAYWNPDTREILLGPGAFIEPEEREWGYEILYSDGNLIDDPELPFPIHSGRNGYEIYGSMDDSPNNRNKYPNNCPEELYDSFVGAKDFAAGAGSCSAAISDPPDLNVPCADGNLAPIAADGTIFRVDVPNGFYRFVAAIGDADNVHAHRILAEDGGEGPPQDGPGENHVVLVHNFDQAQQTIGEADAAEPGEGVYARVGFGGRIPPLGDGVAPSPQFVDMDEDGMPTSGCANSPTLEVTEGYIRFHCLQGNSNDGPGGPRDPNGGDMVILEIWEATPSAPAASLKPGDLNLDRMMNIADAVAHLGFQFGGGVQLPECFIVPGSNPPQLNPAGLAMLDFNGDGMTNIADAVGMLNRLFSGGDPHVLGEGCASIEGSCVSNCTP